MLSTLALAAALLAASPVGADPASEPAAAPRPPKLEWRGEAYDLDELPAELTEGSRGAVLAWAGYAEDRKYELTLSDDQRILLVTPRGKSVKKHLKLVEATCERFDATLPAPAERHDPNAQSMADAPLAEDPDVAPGESWWHAWRADGPPLETATGVVFELKAQDDLEALLELLAAREPYLEQWAASAGQRAGFSLERPLAAAWLTSAADLEEYDPEHELVNRVAQLLALRRFAQLPFWLQQGLAWHFEYEEFGEHYCFPYRAEFVFEVEHGAWLQDLGNLFGDRKKEPLRMREVADWKRGTFDGEAARKSWGLVRYLATYRPEELPVFCESLRVYRDTHGVTDEGGGNWSRIDGWSPPADAQAELLAATTRADVLEEASRCFREGKKFRPNDPKN